MEGVGGEYYTELEAAAMRFKLNHEHMEALLLPDPEGEGGGARRGRKREGRESTTPAFLFFFFFLLEDGK